MLKFEEVGEKFGYEIKWEGKILRLTQDAYIDDRHYGDFRDDSHRYTAIAVDKEDNKHRLYWNVLDEEGFSELEDESLACDWDNPTSVIKL